MSLCMIVLLLLSCFSTYSRGQLTVEIRELDLLTCNNYSVLASYSFPSGFSNPFHWFVEPYTRIPSGGLTGILSYPEPNDGCSPILEPTTQNECEPLCYNNSSSRTSPTDSQLTNFSRIAIVNGYHICTAQKLKTLQEAGFDAMITFSYNDVNPGVTHRVYDQTTNSYVNVPAEEFPVAVVSEEFARVLINNGTFSCRNASDGECCSKPLVVVHVESNDSRQGWIQFGIGAVLVLLVIGLPMLCALCMCLCCICLCSGKCGKKCCCCGLSKCHCKCCRKSGAYQVHELQVRVLGHDFVRGTGQQATLEDGTRGATGNGQHTTEHFRLRFENPTARVRREFNSAKENSSMCAICLEEFSEGKEVEVLPCDDGHIFHVNCIQQWLETHSVCPVCRTLITEPSF